MIWLVSLVCVVVHGHVVRVPGLGSLRGLLDDAGGVSFRNVPFAKAPVGGLRFSRAQPLSEPWVRAEVEAAGGRVVEGEEGCGWETDGRHRGAPCVMTVGLAPERRRVSESEQCLHVSVWVPRQNTSNLPVLLYLHGGGFVLGSSSHYVVAPDPAALARALDVVVVSPQYRLGVFGLFAHPGLDESDGGGAQALGDQRLAMQWVQRHVAAFGGDPSRVTAVGSSAGAISLCFHLVHPETARGQLFRAAVMLSPLCPLPYERNPEANLRARQVAEAVGCARASVAAELQCLRETDAFQLSRAMRSRRGLLWGNGHLWLPSVGNVDAPQDPVHALALRSAAAGENKVVVVAGVNDDEGTLFLLLGFPILVPERFVFDSVAASWGRDKLERMWSRYYPPPEEEMGQGAIWESVTGDLLGGGAFVAAGRLLSDCWACGLARWARAMVQYRSTLPHAPNSSSNVFLYHYDHQLPLPGGLDRLGSFHSSELPVFFQHPPAHDPQAEQVARVFAAHMRSLLHTGLPITHSDPAHPHTPPWTPVHHQTDPRVALPAIRLNANPHDTHFSANEHPDAVSPYRAAPNASHHSPGFGLVCQQLYDSLYDAHDGHLPVPPPRNEPLFSYLLNEVVPNTFASLGGVVEDAVVDKNPDAFAKITVTLLAILIPALLACYRCCYNPKS